TATDSQSLVATIHNTLHVNRATRPHHPALAVRLTHWLGGLALTGVLLLAAGRRPRGDGPSAVLFPGALGGNMLPPRPRCRLPCFCFAGPLVMGLLAADGEQGASPRRRLALALLFTAFLAANVPAQFPGMELLRDCGLATYGTLFLWVTAGFVLRRRRQMASP